MLVIQLAAASSVTRSFSKTSLNQSEIFNVTLAVNITGSTDYGFEEYIPVGFNLVNSGGLEFNSTLGKFTWLCISGSPFNCDTLLNRTFTYSLSAPLVSGTYNFSGIYNFGGPETNISGAKQVNITSSSILNVKINEVETNPIDETKEYIELYNPNAFSVNISGWSLTDGIASGSDVDYIPPSTIIPALGYFVFEETISTLSLNNNDSITLKNSSAAVIDQTPYLNDASNDNRTWQRIPDGSTNWQFVNGTKNATNNISTPSVPTINITSPINGGSYIALNVSLNATSNQAITSWKYSLNNAANITFNQNITITASEGSNTIIVYGTNVNGTGSSSSSFTIILGDTTPPVISTIIATPGSALAAITWNTNENSNSSVAYGLTSALGNIISDVIYVISHLIILSPLNPSTTYYYQVTSCDASGNCANSSIMNFTTSDIPPAGNITDDLMVNYVRGKITIDGVDAPAGTDFSLMVMSGANSRYVYNGSVDDVNIPSISPNLTGRGYFDTKDRIEFNSGASFRITVQGYGCVNESIFANGGNGDFNNESTLTLLNCETANQEPVLDPIGNKDAEENVTLTINLNANDADSGDILTYYTSVTFGSLNPSTGVFNWTPNFGDEGIYSVTFNVTDGEAWDNETIIINVTKTNRAPEFNSSSTILDIILFEDNTTTLNLSQYFSDPDGTPLIYTVSGNSNISITIVNGIATITPGLHWFGSEYVIFRANDSKLTADSNLVNITVIHVNHAPVLQFIGNKNVSENQTLTFTLIASDVDNISAGDVPTYYVIGLPSGASFDNITGIFSWMPNFGQRGSYNVQFYATDGNLTVGENIIINVTRINQAPEFNSSNPIPDSTGVLAWSEDTMQIINLTNSFFDADGDSLSYSVSGNSNISIMIVNGIATLTPIANWSGIEYAVFSASDNVSSVNSNTVTLNITPVNDAPYITGLTNKNINEGQLIIFNVSALDIDNISSELTYSASGLPLGASISPAGEFVWTPNYTQSGNYSLTFIASDGINENNQSIIINVADINQPPVWGTMTIPVLTEDSGFVDNILLNATDNDGAVIRYEIIGETLNQVDCSVTDTSLGLLPGANFTGNSSCIIRAVDNGNSTADIIINITVAPLNDAPAIDSASPNLSSVYISRRANQTFSVSWHDIDNTVAQVFVGWRLNGNLMGIGNSYFFVGNGTKGTYNITVNLDDGAINTSRSWNLIVGSLPITNYFDGNTTNFTGMNDSQLSCVNLTLEKVQYGRVDFTCVDMNDIIDLDSYARISSGLAGIDTNVFTALKNKPASVVLYNLGFSKTPTLYYNSGFTINPSAVTDVCSSSVCTNVSFNNLTKTLTFNTNGFSTFTAGDSPTCSQQSGFLCSSNQHCGGSLIDVRDGVCCNTQCVDNPINFTGVNVCGAPSANFTIELRKPDADEEFNVGEDIDVKLRINNNFGRDKDFDYTVYLYDNTDRTDIENYEDTLSVDANDHEQSEFSIHLADDTEESHDYYVYAYVEDEDNSSSCNSAFKGISIQREKHRLILENFSTSEASYSCESTAGVEISLKNIGRSKEEDIYLVVENEALGISTTSDTFTLEEYDDSPYKATINLDFSLPDNVSPGEYLLKATAHYSGKESESYGTLVLKDCIRRPVEIETIQLTPAEPIETTQLQPAVERQPFCSFEKLFNIFGLNSDSCTINSINLALIIGIGILLLLIIISGLIRLAMR